MGQQVAAANKSSNSSKSQSKRSSVNKVDSISKGISGIDIASGGQTVQQTSVDPSKQNISGKHATQTMKQMLLDQAKQRQKEV